MQYHLILNARKLCLWKRYYLKTKLCCVAVSPKMALYNFTWISCWIRPIVCFSSHMNCRLKKKTFIFNRNKNKRNHNKINDWYSLFLSYLAPGWVTSWWRWKNDTHWAHVEADGLAQIARYSSLTQSVSSRLQHREQIWVCRRYIPQYGQSWAQSKKLCFCLTV